MPQNSDAAFRLGILGFLACYAIYALLTQTYVSGFSADHPERWTLFRIVTVCCTTAIALAIKEVCKRPFWTLSYLIATAAGGLWLLIAPFWFNLFNGFSPGLPVGAALTYGMISGLYGALVTSRWLAALLGGLALIAQIFIDIVGYQLIVGYAGFH